MSVYSLVFSTFGTGGIEVTTLSAPSEEVARDCFESDPDNASCELLHVIAHRPEAVEIVVDTSDGEIDQITSNHPNVSVVFLDCGKNAIQSEIDQKQPDEAQFAPDIDVQGDPNEPWVFRTYAVRQNPDLTRHYLRHTRDAAARRDFNQAVLTALDGKTT